MYIYIKNILFNKSVKFVKEISAICKCVYLEYTTRDTVDRIKRQIAITGKNGFACDRKQPAAGNKQAST